MKVSCWYNVVISRNSAQAENLSESEVWQRIQVAISISILVLNYGHVYKTDKNNC